LKKLSRVGASALAAGFIETTLMMFVGYQIAQLFGNGSQWTRCF
jgi:hypothetical protein